MKLFGDRAKRITTSEMNLFMAKSEIDYPHVSRKLNYPILLNPRIVTVTLILLF